MKNVKFWVEAGIAVLLATFIMWMRGVFEAKDLAGRFIKNFAKYEGNDAGKALVPAGPQL